MKQIQPIRNKKDCDAATREIERLMDKETSKKLTNAEAARLEVLATLVDTYESALVQDVPADPVEALKFRLEQLGLPLSDLARTLGSRPRASEILSRKRRMTLPMIRKIHEEYGVPPEQMEDYISGCVMSRGGSTVEAPVEDYSPPEEDAAEPAESGESSDAGEATADVPQ